jgi:hypothetical protein
MWLEENMVFFFFCPKDIHFEILVIHDGAVHFISNCFPYIANGSSYYRPYIMAYDIDNGTSKILNVQNGYLQIGERGKKKFQIYMFD